MPMSLKCMINKWLHKNQISQEEYDAVIKKLEGHDKQIRAEAIEEVIKLYKEFQPKLATNVYEFGERLRQMQKGAENE